MPTDGDDCVGPVENVEDTFPPPGIGATEEDVRTADDLNERSAGALSHTPGHFTIRVRPVAEHHIRRPHRGQIGELAFEAPPHEPAALGVHDARREIVDRVLGRTTHVGGERGGTTVFGPRDGRDDSNLVAAGQRLTHLQVEDGLPVIVRHGKLVGEEENLHGLAVPDAASAGVRCSTARWSSPVTGGLAIS